MMFGLIGVITGVIGLVIVDSLITDDLFSGTLNTVMQNVPVLMGVSLLLIAGGWVIYGDM